MEQAHSDLAERVHFGLLPCAPTGRFDQRLDAELREVAAEHGSALERERALWELGARGDSASFIAERQRSDGDPSVRWNLLWLLAKIDDNQLARALVAAATDESPEVRDWANVFREETLGTERKLVRPDAVYSTSGEFDQTLPLEIAGYADVFASDDAWVRANLSPLWFNSIMGRVMAAVNASTFMSDLVIEKELHGYNPDGTNHYEPFLFRGASVSLSPGVVQHVYESTGSRRFYESGRVKEGPSIDVEVTLARVAVTERVTGDELSIASLEADGARGDRLRDFGVVRSVRGRFSGWAFTDLERFSKAGYVAPGTVQLTSPTDPRVGARTNTLLHGTFRGKLADRNGDGRYDINTIPCHATLDGQFDLDCDGERDHDPFADTAELVGDLG